MESTDYRQKAKEMIADIRVIPIDMNKLSEYFDKGIKEELAKCGDSKLVKQPAANEFFGVRGSMGFIKGTNMVVDTDCTAELIDEKIAVPVYSETREENGKSFSLIPSYKFKVILSELVDEFGKPEISLEEFMDSRCAGNSRICSNMNDIAKEYKLQTKG